MTLVKSVLTGLPVYWFSLLQIPTFIINYLRKLFYNFLWTGGLDCSNLVMTRWEFLALPECYGGWGIRNLSYFSYALRLKSLWRGLFGTTLWSIILSVKYIKGDVLNWIRNPLKVTKGTSSIWVGFIKVYSWMARDLSWRVGNGKDILVGIDPILGLDDTYTLSNEVIYTIHRFEFATLSKIKRTHKRENQSYWLNALEMGFQDETAMEWDRYINKLNAVGCRLTKEKYKLIWINNSATGMLNARLAYRAIIKYWGIYPPDWWYKVLWKWKIPLKIQCFMWQALRGCLKTWENLSKRGWIGPSICFLCKLSLETSNHILVDCGFTRSLWYLISLELQLTELWGTGPFRLCALMWHRHCKDLPYLPVVISWEVWRSINDAIFNNRSPTLSISCHRILMTIKYFCSTTDLSKTRVDTVPFISDHKPVAFFDGPEVDGRCAVGGVIFINKEHYYTLRLNCGRCTNTKVELLGLWSVLTVSHAFGHFALSIFGDSRVTIKWAKGDYELNVIFLYKWCCRIKEKIKLFKEISFKHIYRQHNAMADALSKEAHDGVEGYIRWEEFMEAQCIESGSENIYLY